MSLLGIGKKIYMNPKVTTYKMFQENKIEIFSMKEEINLSKLSQINRTKNVNIVKKVFSKENFIEQLSTIFEN